MDFFRRQTVQERGSYPLLGDRLMQFMQPIDDLVMGNGYRIEHQPFAFGIVEILPGKGIRSSLPTG
ncbi:hypothetical protein D3C75_1081230 [compost metagenome]